MRTIYVERETVELVPFVVERDDVVVTTGLEAVVVPEGTRPTTGWAAAVNVSGKTCVLASGLAAGRYKVYARITDSPETAVIHAGDIVAR